MTNSSLLGQMDDYFLRARVYPGLIVILPFGLFIELLLPTIQLRVITPLVISAGGAFLLGNISRSAGKKLETRLITRWGGLPTTRMLRYKAREENHILFDRRRLAIERVTGISLPSQQDETAGAQSSSDDYYKAAVRVLITKVRDKKDDYPRVHDENVSYGFRRNLLGLKPQAITILAVSFIGDIFTYHLRGASSTVDASALLNVSMLFFWLFYARIRWVEQASVSYAERLFECLEQL